MKAPRTVSASSAKSPARACPRRHASTTSRAAPSTARTLTSIPANLPTASADCVTKLAAAARPKWPCACQASR